ANRRFFHGPGINNFDVGVSKRIPLTEAMALEFRGEFFNVFNHAQFFNPGGDIDSSNFGEVTQARDPRIGQVSAKLVWRSDYCGRGSTSPVFSFSCSLI